MLHFICGRIRSGKTTYLIEKIKNNPGKKALFLVPEQFSHSMERLLCEACGNSVSSYAEVTNFRRLATKIKSETGGIATETVGGGERILLLHRALALVAPSLGYMEKLATPERLEDILSAIDEFKAYGISPEQLAKAKDNLSSRCGEKISDLAMIYAAYENELGEDEHDAYDELALVVKTLQRAPFFENKTVLFDGFSGFTAAEFDIISAALSQADDVYVALELDGRCGPGDENGIFDKASETKKRLEELAERAGCGCDEAVLCRKADDALSFIDGALFANRVCEYEGSAANITIARADNVFEECEKCAAYILDGVRSGRRYRDFSVAVTDGREYTNICSMVFRRYGIPVYVSDAAPLTSKPAMSLVLAAFECIIHGYRSDSVMQYLKTGFSGVCSKSLDVFENYMYTWAPKSREWTSGKDFVKNPFGLAAEENDESRAILRVVNRTRRRIFDPVEKLKRAMLRGKTGEKCAEALYDFINEINLPRRISAYIYLAELSGRVQLARESETVMKLLCDTIDSLGQAIGEREVSVEEFYQLLKLVAGQYELDTIPASLDCVSIGSVARADGERCKVRIILGAHEGAFPSVSDSHGVITDNDRTELSDCGIELAPGVSERAYEAYRTVHSVICSGEDALYISSSAFESSGEDRYEASALSRIRKVFRDISEGIDIAHARYRAKVPCFDESIAEHSMEKLWENDCEYAPKLQNVKRNISGKRGPIRERENIEAVFGKRIRLSASRADVFSSCRYEYFLKYGLNVKERERAELSAIEAGTLMHYVLEKVIAALAEKNSFEAEEAERLAGEACREYVSMTLRGAGEFSGRDGFLLRRLEKTVKSAVEDICRELRKSKFRPREFELAFLGKEDTLPPLSIKGELSEVQLRGAVDRVDMYEDGEHLYFRVIDYKSGKKAFSVDEALNGVGMQMLLYMFALEEMGAERYGRVPEAAGVMYVPLARNYSDKRGELPSAKRREGVVLRDMDIIGAMESGDLKEYIPVKLTKSGGIDTRSSVVLTKREFAAVKDKMKSILARIGDELASGEIEPNPYIHKQHSPCDWCDYKSVCAFDEERCGDTKRELLEIRLGDIIEEIGGETDE